MLELRAGIDRLVLLTSVAFAVGVVRLGRLGRLGRRNVLVQEPAAVETLARVDVVCLDKTSTLIEPSMRVATVERLDPTCRSMRWPRWRPPNGSPTRARPRSVRHSRPRRVGRSRRCPPSPRPAGGAGHGSPATGGGCWELRTSSCRPGTRCETVRTLLQGKARACCCSPPTCPETKPARSPDGCPAWRQARRWRSGPGARRPRAAGAADAAGSLRYFADQQVGVRIISGDNPAAVAAVGRRLGVAGAESGVDGRQLPSGGKALATAMDRDIVFGRVAPCQKAAGTPRSVRGWATSSGAPA